MPDIKSRIKTAQAGRKAPQNGETNMFKKFLQEIIEAESSEELNKIFYRADGVDMSFQREKISWKEHEMLADLINKLNGYYKPIQKEG